MAKHIYDEEGNYKGKILNDEEHYNNSKYSSSITWGDLFGFMKNKDRTSSDKNMVQLSLGMVLVNYNLACRVIWFN